MASTWWTILELPGTTSVAMKYRSSPKEVGTNGTTVRQYAWQISANGICTDGASYFSADADMWLTPQSVGCPEVLNPAEVRATGAIASGTWSVPYSPTITLAAADLKWHAEEQRVPSPNADRSPLNYYVFFYLKAPYNGTRAKADECLGELVQSVVLKTSYYLPKD